MHLHLDGLGTINLDTGALANDLRGVAKVIQKSTVDSSQSAGSGTRLLGVVATRGLGEDAALGNENDVAVRELLLQLAGHAILNVSYLS